MRALVIFLFVLGAVAFMASCGSEVTEVAWKNAGGSDGNITDITWNMGEATWSSKYSPGGVPSESKEVASSTGRVD
ncbi:MAG: hypothetical protein KBA61_08810, partial [Spirochaetes bacterium]|nr:hypothetical protein [Spirochaetota bacterium]